MAWQKWLLLLGAFSITLATVPRALCGRLADDYFDAEVGAQRSLADGVAERVLDKKEGDRLFFHTGMARFDGQSAIAVYQMTLLGLGQVVLSHPELRDTYLPAMERAADQLVDPETLQYAAERYGFHGAVLAQGGDRTATGHAYLGYINLGLGMLRRVSPNTRHAATHDRITDFLTRQLQRAPHGLIETYPEETWPPDVAAAAGSIGLHAQATGVDRRGMLKRWGERFAACAIHSSGYLVQRVETGSCDSNDAPRGSGTAVAAYFLSFAHPELSKRLYRAVHDTGMVTVGGFGGVREYAPGFSGGGDVNAGPIVFGMSVGATGFALGAALVHRDRETFTALYRSTHLFGAPVARAGQRRHAMGGMLGDALLLAMLTARPT